VSAVVGEVGEGGGVSAEMFAAQTISIVCCISSGVFGLACWPCIPRTCLYCEPRYNSHQVTFQCTGEYINFSNVRLFAKPGSRLPAYDASSVSGVCCGSWQSEDLLHLLANRLVVMHPPPGARISTSGWETFDLMQRRSSLVPYQTIAQDG